jgi:hypothetical protein
VLDGQYQIMTKNCWRMRSQAYLESLVLRFDSLVGVQLMKVFDLQICGWSE